MYFTVCVLSASGTPLAPSSQTSEPMPPDRTSAALNAAQMVRSALGTTTEAMFAAAAMRKQLAGIPPGRC
jgi:hypothetical protein